MFVLLLSPWHCGASTEVSLEQRNGTESDGMPDIAARRATVLASHSSHLLIHMSRVFLGYWEVQIHVALVRTPRIFLVFQLVHASIFPDHSDRRNPVQNGSRVSDA